MLRLELPRLQIPPPNGPHLALPGPKNSRSLEIHGKLHPMIAVITIGDCELIILRRASPWAPMSLACHTEMQRIDGHAQTPLQLARVDERIDPVAC